MVGKRLVPLVLALVVGCGPAEPHVTPVPEARTAPAVSPAETRMMLESLRSDDPRVQYAALETLSRLPSVAQAHREHVERLQREGGNERVRQKAAELLASLEAK
jgi:hypothetical protein